MEGRTAPGGPSGANLHSCDWLVVVVSIVIPIVPIALGMPALIVFVPPPVILTPAPFPSLVQLSTLVICLGAVAAVFLDCLVQFVFSVLDAALASFVVVSMKPGYRRYRKHP